MWTSKSVTVTPEANSTKMKVDAVLTNGNAVEDVSISTVVSTVQEVKQAVKQNITRLNERDEAVVKAADGTLLDEPEPDAPTKAELDRKEWFEKYAQLQQAQPLIELGIIAADDNRLTTLQTWLSDKFKAAYLSEL